MNELVDISQKREPEYKKKPTNKHTHTHTQKYYLCINL